MTQSIESRAISAKYELSITDEAFRKLRQMFLDEAAAAKTPDDAYRAVLKVQSVELVRTALQSVIDDAEFERKAAELRASQQT